MANIPIIAPTTAAVATQVPISVGAYPNVTIAASGLSGAETVGVFVMVAGSWALATNTEGSDGTLTATLPMKYFPGGATYGVTKSATVAASGVDAIVPFVV